MDIFMSVYFTIGVLYLVSFSGFTPYKDWEEEKEVQEELVKVSNKLEKIRKGRADQETTVRKDIEPNTIN